MTYQIKKLVEGFPKVVYVEKDEPLSKVVSLMLENDFSQIPVIQCEYSENGKVSNEIPVGIITTDDVLQAMEDFKAPISDLIAHNAMHLPLLADIDDDIFDLFDKVLKDGAVIIAQGVWLHSIVTSSDIVDFFKQQTIEALYLEDIETSVKEIIQYFFMDEDSNVDLAAINEAISGINISTDNIKKKLGKSISTYLTETGNSSKLKPSALEKSVNAFGIEKKIKAFDDLSFNEFIMLLTNSDRWEFYQPIFKVNNSAVRVRLESVRDIRNQLAHYRGEINYTQRKLLKSTWEWISRCQTEFEEERENKRINGLSLQSDQHDISDYEIESEIIPLEEGNNIGLSKYVALANYLRKQSKNINKVKLTFDEIEAVLGFQLPPSAYASRAWWANDTTGHVQSKEWLEAGWRVGYRNLSAKTVDFVRIKDREKDYIDYFSTLLVNLRNNDELRVKETSSPSGVSWLTISGVVVDGTQKSIFAIAFASGNRYRIELYIDTGNKIINKNVYDELFECKSEIESELGAKLNWERIPEKRASRIALYQSGSISDSDNKLKELQDWTIRNYPKFYTALHDRSQTVLLKHLTENND